MLVHSSILVVVVFTCDYRFYMEVDDHTSVEEDAQH